MDKDSLNYIVNNIKKNVNNNEEILNLKQKYDNVCIDKTVDIILLMVLNTGLPLEKFLNSSDNESSDDNSSEKYLDTEDFNEKLKNIENMDLATLDTDSDDNEVKSKKVKKDVEVLRDQLLNLNKI